MRQPTIDRRDFLRLSSLGVSVAATYPLFLRKTAAAMRGGDPELREDRVLVVLQLSGGNDGLSTVVPFADPDYGRAREVTRVGERAVLRIDEHLGLHPNLKEVKELLDRGEATIVQGVSYPNPTRSHFESMDVWHAADRDGARRGSGWLGRAIDSTCGNRANPLLALNVGESLPLALTGEKAKPLVFRSPQNYEWRGPPGAREAFATLNSAGAGGQGLEQLNFLRRVAADANTAAADIRGATQRYRPSAPYPGGNRLAEDLRMVAAMVAAALPTRIFYVSFGGFDTHANQRGRHDNLMRALDGALGAFTADLRAHGLLDRVLIMTFSEFGRRVKENASRGTDHGVAGPMFLLGGGVTGGLHGRHPSLTELVAGDLAMTVDFRQVYATVLEHWLGAPAEQVLGSRWEPMPFLRTVKGAARERQF